jgi:hypothetical protein
MSKKKRGYIIWLVVLIPLAVLLGMAYWLFHQPMPVRYSIKEINEAIERPNLPEPREKYYGPGDTLRHLWELADTFIRSAKGDSFALVTQKVKFAGTWFYEGREDTPKFYPLTFRQPFDFFDCRFGSLIPDRKFLIGDVRFDSSVRFRLVDYQTSPLFFYCIFEEPVGFSSAFRMPVNKNYPSFQNCQFFKGIDFHQSKTDLRDKRPLPTDLHIINSTISGKLDLSGWVFDSCTFNLDQSTAPDTLDLSGASGKASLDLTGLTANTSGKPCELILTNADLTNLKLQYQYFHLYFPPATTRGPAAKDIISSTYEALLANLKRNGFDDSYKKLDIEFKNWQSSNDWWDIISRYWWLYGYQKWRILLWSLGLLLAFSLWNAFIYDKMLATYKLTYLNPENFGVSKYPVVKALQKYMLSMLFTGVIFFRLTLDFSNIDFKKRRLLFLLFFEYGVGLLCTGYLINWILAK